MLLSSVSADPSYSNISLNLDRAPVLVLAQLRAAMSAFTFDIQNVQSYNWGIYVASERRESHFEEAGYTLLEQQAHLTVRGL